ncbi:Transcriptional regulatory protein LiaR [Frondihabitans sp. 762G35]|uniref:response regulator n=1 Tax=Frondihabitans sp. 762G35 TaxID=1446794 RepID=UPI000D20758A|nr:response regulator transcription factor [Frondihabitans sp. 762G35]ARC58637.1 Transcriptional regulatory protein LiaR [Frondihabitans sp. 762G35]
MIRVLVVDDQAVIRSGLLAILRADARLEVVGEAADGEEALAYARETVPDVVLLDLRMPRLDGVETTRRLRLEPALSRTRILVLTTFDSDANVVEAIRAGADGFLGKGVEPDVLVDSVMEVARGDAALSQAAQRALMTHIGTAKPPTAAEPAAVDQLASLTDRERDIVTAVAYGQTNDQIAAALFISPYTVKTHLNRAMAKAGVSERSQMVILAYRAHLVPPPS